MNPIRSSTYEGLSEQSTTPNGQFTLTCLSSDQIEGGLTVDFLEKTARDVTKSRERVLLSLRVVVDDIRKNKGVGKSFTEILYDVGTLPQMVESEAAATIMRATWGVEAQALFLLFAKTRILL